MGSIYAGSHAEAMVMGDTVLFEDEVNPAMIGRARKRTERYRLAQSFSSSTIRKVYFMHIEGQGTTADLASALRKIYDKIKEVRAAIRGRQIPSAELRCRKQIRFRPSRSTRFSGLVAN